MAEEAVAHNGRRGCLARPALAMLGYTVKEAGEKIKPTLAWIFQHPRQAGCEDGSTAPLKIICS